GVERPPVVIDQMLVPPEAHGVRCISMGFFVEEDQPVIWRGPMLHKALEQFLTDVYWDDPDFLLIDMPPGTGDIAISLSQYLLPANFYLEITLQSSLCQPQDQAGINFWYQSSSDFYRLLINCAGQYRLELIQDGRNFVIHDWETAIEIQPGAPASNRVGIWTYQGQLELFFNDTFQREERVSTEQSGGLALFARSIESSAMTVKFSDLKIFSVEKD
ncbi:MAG: P-loop NTPase, partial [Anaerolineales bacterium]